VSDHAEPAAQISREITRHGQIPFSRFMELALYSANGGFYTRGGAGASRDFLTSPEVSTVFGELIARAITDQWNEWGQPDPFFVVEYGAGTGALAASILGSEQPCLAAMRYVAIEATDQQVGLCANRLGAVKDSELLGAQHFDPELEQFVVTPNQGPLVSARTTAPVIEYPAIVLANELLDNIPFDVFDRDGNEVFVVTSEDGFAWTGEPSYPHMAAASAFVSSQLARQYPTVVWLFDYTRPTRDDFGAISDWLRTFRGGARGVSPLIDVGMQDITADVALDQLPQPTRITTQCDWLTQQGALQMREQANEQWLKHAHAPTLADLKTKSRISEIDRLLDPQHLGGFTFCEWSN